MNIINVPLEKLLKYRCEKNKEIFAQEVDSQNIEVFIQATSSLVLRSVVPNNHPKFSTVIQNANKSINLESLMIESHDFSDSSEWPESDSTFTLIPYSGYKLIVTSIVARFPETVGLADNPISFNIYKSLDGITPVDEYTSPVITETYASIRDLLIISNSPWDTSQSIVTSFTNKMIEAKFRYAATDYDDWSKLTLCSSLNEQITITLNTNTPLLDNEGSPLTDPCYAIFNTKRVVEF